jgi:multisubunit Na+/H+ antiporter MnhF subunit
MPTSPKSAKTGGKPASWWDRTLGRSLYGLIFGNNLADKNVAATIISIMLVGTLCYLAVTLSESQARQSLINALANLVFGVVGYYFGSRRAKADEGKSS